MSPTKPPKPCIRCGATAVTGRSLCRRHLNQDRARTDNRRGTAAQRGYNREHDNRFRDGVFLLYGDRCIHTGPVDVQLCNRPATHADHFPRSRRELEAAGQDPNDPHHGRPLCEHHHNQHTGKTQSRLATRKQR